MGKYATEFKENKYINRNYIIHYYPDSADTHTNELIGKMKLYDLLKDYRTRKSVLKMIMNNKKDVLSIKLRRGIMFRLTTK